MMKKLKIAAASVAIALGAGMTTGAQAALTGSNNLATGSSLYLFAWVEGVASYARDLGLTLASVLNPSNPADINSATGPNANWVSEYGFTFTNLGDQLFSDTFGSNIGNVRWSVIAGDSINSPATFGYVSTFSNGPSGSLTAPGTVGVAGRIGGLANSMNLAGCSSSVSCAITNPATTGFITNNGDADWSTDAGGANIPSPNNVSGLGTSSVDFWYVRGTSTSPLAQSSLFQFKNSLHEGNWTLSANGTVTYSLAAAEIENPNPVPLPGAVWLLGSGLLGLAAVARRRRNGAAA